MTRASQPRLLAARRGKAAKAGAPSFRGVCAHHGEAARAGGGGEGRHAAPVCLCLPTPFWTTRALQPATTRGGRRAATRGRHACALGHQRGKPARGCAQAPAAAAARGAHACPPFWPRLFLEIRCLFEALRRLFAERAVLLLTLRGPLPLSLLAVTTHR